MKESLTLRLSGGTTAPSRARTALRGLDRTLGELCVDVDLLVSELVSNSVLHARAAEVELRAVADPDRVRIEVSDPGPGFDEDAAPRTPSLTGEGGYGLFIVDKLANRWGVNRNGCARVWAEIDRRPGQDSSPRSGSERNPRFGPAVPG